MQNGQTFFKDSSINMFSRMTPVIFLFRTPMVVQFTSLEMGTAMIVAKGKIKFTTLDLPLLVGTKIGSNKLNLRFMGGPILSFIIDENNTLGSAYNSVIDFGNYKKQTLGFQAGSGIDLGNLTFDVRYESGLSNVSQSEKYSQQQNLVHLSLGFKLF